MMTRTEYNRLMNQLPERELPSAVYDGYRDAREATFTRFMESRADFENLEKYKLLSKSSIRQPIPINSYRGVEICGLPLEEVGCGILTLAQGLARCTEIVSREYIIDLTQLIEAKGYYKKGAGLYWHIFKYFAGYHPAHWYEVYMAIAAEQPVTVLLNVGKPNRLFTNLLGTKNIIIEQNGGRYMPIYHPDDFVFYTSEGMKITLFELMKPGFLATAPWIWPFRI